jgi:uncharacterized damage-inducible protein DinB
MPSSDFLEILLAHDRWATGQLLEFCEDLSDEQFHQRFEMGVGSLHDSVTHILGAMRTWTDSLAEREGGQRLEENGQKHKPKELAALLDSVADALAAEARRKPVSDTISRRLRSGKTFAFTRAAVLTHVATHSMHHRAQCLNMLRQLGVKPLPPSSVTEWTFLGAGK